MTSLARMESLLEQATAKNPLAADAWARLAGVKAAFDRDAPALAAAERAVAMVPGRVPITLRLEKPPADHVW